MVRKIFFLALLITFLLSGCKPKQHKSSEVDSPSASTVVKYAKGFAIEDFKTYQKLTVLNPWQKSSGISYSYYLVPRNQKVPASLKGKNIVRTPVKRQFVKPKKRFYEPSGENFPKGKPNFRYQKINARFLSGLSSLL